LAKTIFSSRRAYAVWEITLRCNLACRHCGSRAGRAREGELTTGEALDLVQQLAQVGVDEVTLIGGEAFLRPDWLAIAAAVREAGMICTMTTGGYGITSTKASQMKRAGISHVSVSIDGLEETHDALRGRKGSWRHCFAAIKAVREAGIVVSSNTQLNRLSAPQLPILYERLLAAGVRGWQVQLTAPMGNAAENPSILLQPPELLDLFPMLARIARRAWQDGIVFLPGNNVGYYGPYERLLRSNGHPWGFWQGPNDGRSIIGIESDGSIKADPTLPSRSYIGGNIRHQRLREIIETAPELNFIPLADSPGGTDHLWGYCRACEFAPVCRGGSPWTTHVLFGRHGNNPYCHHRALTKHAQGVRERIVQREASVGLPYDHGSFEIVEESDSTSWPHNDALHFTEDKVVWPDEWPDLGPAPVQPITRASTAPLTASSQKGRLLPRPKWSSEARMLQAFARVKRALDASEHLSNCDAAD
jgi:radical SAM protein with 4Fe4S-binding SPASM domain